MNHDWHVLYTAHCEGILLGAVHGCTVQEMRDAQKWGDVLQWDMIALDDMAAKAWNSEPSLRKALVATA